MRTLVHGHRQKAEVKFQLLLQRLLPRRMECSGGIAMGILSVRPSVCLSVCLSVCQTRALWQNGRKLCLDFYIIWKNIYSSFLRRRMIGGGDPFYLKFGSIGPHLSEIADFVRASAVRPSEKVQLTLIGSPYALSNEPKMIIVRCP